MRGPYNAQYRPDSQSTTGAARHKDLPPNVKGGHNRLQRKPDPALAGCVPVIGGKDRTLRGKTRRNARKAARR